MKFYFSVVDSKDKILSTFSKEIVATYFNGDNDNEQVKAVASEAASYFKSNKSTKTAKEAKFVLVAEDKKTVVYTFALLEAKDMTKLSEHDIIECLLNVAFGAFSEGKFVKEQVESKPEEVKEEAKPEVVTGAESNTDDDGYGKIGKILAAVVIAALVVVVGFIIVDNQ